MTLWSCQRSKASTCALEYTHGRVRKGEFYAQRFQGLIYRHLFTDCFMNISPQSLAQIHSGTVNGTVYVSIIVEERSS